MQQTVEHYLSSRQCSSDYAQALRRVARSLQQHGLANPSAFSEASFNRWLKSLDQSPTTVSNYRRMGMTIWKHAARQKLVDDPSGDLLKVKPRVSPPIAWSMDELQRLLRTCRGLDGHFKISGCPRWLFFTAMVLAGYELGVRKGDLHNLRVDQVRGQRVHIVQNKTGIVVGKIISQECSGLLQQLIALGDGKTVFRWALGRKWLYLNFRQVVKQAGLTGSLKYLRRSGATHCEIAHPGSAGKFLGHLSPGLAAKYYLDPTLLAETQPRPPAIPGLAVFSPAKVSD